MKLFIVTFIVLCIFITAVYAQNTISSMHGNICLETEEEASVDFKVQRTLIAYGDHEFEVRHSLQPVGTTEEFIDVIIEKLQDVAYNFSDGNIPMHPASFAEDFNAIWYINFKFKYINSGMDGYGFAYTTDEKAVIIISPDASTLIHVLFNIYDCSYIPARPQTPLIIQHENESCVIGDGLTRHTVSGTVDCPANSAHARSDTYAYSIIAQNVRRYRAQPGNMSRIEISIVVHCSSESTEPCSINYSNVNLVIDKTFTSRLSDTMLPGRILPGETVSGVLTYRITPANLNKNVMLEHEFRGGPVYFSIQTN